MTDTERRVQFSEVPDPTTWELCDGTASIKIGEPFTLEWFERVKRLSADLAEERREHRASLIFAAQERERMSDMARAARLLYEETADYINLNNLGDVHHNRSMQMMRDELAKWQWERGEPSGPAEQACANEAHPAAAPRLVIKSPLPGVLKDVTVPNMVWGFDAGSPKGDRVGYVSGEPFECRCGGADCPYCGG